MKVDIDTFIQNHTHINYCEAVIDPEGLIDYVSPSHIENMIRETGLTRKEIYDEMEITASPLHWLIKYTNSLCVWSKGYISSKYVSSEQELALAKLIAAGLVDNNRF